MKCPHSPHRDHLCVPASPSIEPIWQRIEALLRDTPQAQESKEISNMIIFLNDCITYGPWGVGECMFEKDELALSSHVPLCKKIDVIENYLCSFEGGKEAIQLLEASLPKQLVERFFERLTIHHTSKLLGNLPVHLVEDCNLINREMNDSFLDDGHSQYLHYTHSTAQYLQTYGLTRLSDALHRCTHLTLSPIGVFDEEIEVFQTLLEALPNLKILEIGETYLEDKALKALESFGKRIEVLRIKVPFTSGNESLMTIIRAFPNLKRIEIFGDLHRMSTDLQVPFLEALLSMQHLEAIYLHNDLISMLPPETREVLKALVGKCKCVNLRLSFSFTPSSEVNAWLERLKQSRSLTLGKTDFGQWTPQQIKNFWDTLAGKQKLGLFHNFSTKNLSYKEIQSLPTLPHTTHLSLNWYPNSQDDETTTLLFLKKFTHVSTLDLYILDSTPQVIRYLHAFPNITTLRLNIFTIEKILEAIGGNGIKSLFPKLEHLVITKKEYRDKKKLKLFEELEGLIGTDLQNK